MGSPTDKLLLLARGRRRGGRGRGGDGGEGRG